MSGFLRLIRAYNLLFVAIIQVVIYQVVLVPVLQKYGFQIPDDTLLLVLLVVATVCVAAGGYVLNDYFDVKIDAINRPDKQIVGRSFTRQAAMLMHQIFTAVGILLGLLLAWKLKSFSVAMIYIVVPGMLWFYSATYKRQFMIGNLMVAFMSALVILLVVIVKLAVLELEYGTLIFETPIPKEFYAWGGGFALFSFLTTWIREIVKDMEDEAGDREMECRTMPIVWGVKRSKIFVYSLIALTISLLVIIERFYISFEGNLTLKYILLMLVAPLVVAVWLVYKAQKPAAYHQVSVLLKVIMLSGVIYSFVFYFLMAKTYGFSLFDLFVIK
ncbi:MAG: UbiA prenyltransferase [Bacteroidetes bacterium]|nr:UbiA prenyltransferase [Bacteroidota bacterium]